MRSGYVKKSVPCQNSCIFLGSSNEQGNTVLSGEATNTNFIVFGLTRPGLEQDMYVYL
jgi:hypothetical protein